MIEYLNKSMFDFTEHVTLAHGVNCQGVMGSGVAKVMKNEYPEVFFYYKDYCDRKFDSVLLSDIEKLKYLDSYRSDPLLGVSQLIYINHDLHIANLFTQRYYGKDGKVYACIKSINNSLRNLCEQTIFPVVIPKIGCGLGGLNWENDVQPIVESVASDFSRDFYVCSI